MLKVNRQTDYAVRVILALAKRAPGARLSSAIIRQEMLIPAAFMSRIVAQLATHGLVTTFAGRDGGLQLPRPADEINLRDVLEAFEGPILLSECMRPSHVTPFSPEKIACLPKTDQGQDGGNGGDADCPFRANCPVRSKWGRVQMVMLRELASISFADLAAEALADVPLSSGRGVALPRPYNTDYF